MKKPKKRLILLAVLPLVAWLVASGGVSEELSSERALLENSTSFTLYSIRHKGAPQIVDEDSPDARQVRLDNEKHEREHAAAEKFHGNAILGQVEITDPREKARLIAALYSGIERGWGRGSLCFSPRHGIRATLGLRKIDLVICFECSRMDASSYTSLYASSIRVNASPQPVFDASLRRAKVPLGFRPDVE